MFGRDGQGEPEAGEDKPHTERTTLPTQLHGKKAPLLLRAKGNGLWLGLYGDRPNGLNWQGTSFKQWLNSQTFCSGL